MSSSSLPRALERFSAELRGLTLRVVDGVVGLKRGAESRPCAGADAFRENLDDLEQQVADVAAEVQQLERCTTDAVSFEELLGHCVALYRSNRRGATELVAYLQQYGYEAPSSTQREPEDPCAAVASAAGGPASTGRLGSDEFCLEDGNGSSGPMLDGNTAAGEALRGRAGVVSAASSPGAGPQHRNMPPATRSLPASPVSIGFLASGYVPSRLGLGQPGSPMRGGGGATAEMAVFGLCGHDTGGPEAAETARKPGQRQRPSAGNASAVSLTPDAAALLSPGLADKYACPSSGVPSEPEICGGPGRADVRASGGSAAASGGRRPAARDLRLDYGRCASDSPSMPIFGVTPRSASLPASTVAGLPDALPLAACCSGGSSAAGLGPAPGGSSLLPDISDTGDLYGMLIRSNMGLPAAPSASPPVTTPPALSPRRAAALAAEGGALARPTTPGSTLPHGWHEHALQELDSLSLTFSRLKPTPSRGLLADPSDAAAAGCAGDEAGEGKDEEDVTLGDMPCEAAGVREGGSGGGGGQGGLWGVAPAEGWEVHADLAVGGGYRRAGVGGSGDGSSGTVLRERQEAASPPWPGGAAWEKKASPVRARQQLGCEREQEQQQQAPSTPTTRAALRRQQQQQVQDAAAVLTVAPVEEDEFASLPAWCSRQLSLAELNAALEGIGAAVAAADSTPLAPTDASGALAGSVGLDTLEALGFGAAKGRAILNCLSKLGRAQLRSASGGTAYYGLVPR